jgi:mono/diheme cytochrome c family protein
MNTSIHIEKLLIAIVATVLAYSTPLTADEPKKTDSVDFAKQILPLLSNKCFVCHGPDAKQADLLRLDSFAGATRDLGGHQAINPKAPEKSELLARINSTEEPMPPADAEKQLTAIERDLLNRWVRQGGTYAKHWAFVPPVKSPPKSNPTAKGASVIDSFIQQQFKGFKLADEADQATLARRAALVLTGLPPDPKTLEAFLNDKKSGAYERLVDRLLTSERFGEHQARYWLDAVRYGDTHGLHLDNKRGIYPYRDWVVQALNSNLPLNDFITWQIAGDLLPNHTLAQKVATGYIRLNPTTGEGGAIPAEFQAKNSFDRVETFGTVFLGMSLTCARCHTHKYDPIPQTEYYRLLAFFNSTAEHSMDGNKYTYGPHIRTPQNQVAWKEWNDLEAARNTLVDKATKQIQSDQKLAADVKSKWTSSAVGARLTMLSNAKGPLASLGFQKTAAELAGRIAAAEKNFTTSLVTQELATPRETRLLKRGEYHLPQGDKLQPGIVSVMSEFPKDAPRNRIGLAQWLTSKKHPLVSRVLLNRIWQRTFGHGLVRTPEDFGLQGQHPTHPELLDWLAVELQDSGWNLKHMLKLMVTSRTFKQSSTWRKGIEDPENKLFARGPRYRLDAEILRDLALWSSGLLDPHMGGEGVKPYQPVGMWKALAHPGSNTKQYVRDKGKLLYRRSLYVYWKRTSPHPMMTLFDAPDRESSCVRRSRTNTSLQSLGLLNETQRIEMSRVLAERLIQEGGKNDASRLNYLFRFLACRNATDQEKTACLTLLNIMKDRYAAAEKDAAILLATGEISRDTNLNTVEVAAWTQVAVIVLASDVAIMLY